MKKNEKIEQIKCLVEQAFEPFADNVILVTSREIKRSLHTEWVVVANAINQIVAVFSIGGNCLYKIKYIDASYLPEMAELRKYVEHMED